MKAPIKKELMKCFDAELEARWPQFAVFDSEQDAKTWSWKASPNLMFFVTVQALEGKEQFVIEVSWNEIAEFPWGAMGKVKAESSQGRERLGRLWESGPSEPVWDVLPEKTARQVQDLDSIRQGKGIPSDPPFAQIQPRVMPLVRDAIDKFEKYGVPLFRRVAEAHGITSLAKGRD